MQKMKTHSPPENGHGRTAPNRCSVWLLMACFLVLIYSNTFNSPWALDDPPNISENENIRITSLNFSELKHSMYFDGKISRPLARLSFALNWYLGGPDVTGFHIVNILIHIFTCFFLYLSIRLILQTPYLDPFFTRNKEFIALLSAILWAGNPIQTQAVTYIVQRMASMAALFYIMGMFAYLRARLAKRRNVKWYFGLLTMVFFVGGVSSKENVVLLPLSLLLLEICFFHNVKNSKKKRLIIVSSIVSFGAVICGVLFFWMYWDNPVDYFGNFLRQYSDRPFTPWQRMLTQPRILLFYLSQIFYPIADRLSIAHCPVFSTSLLHPWTTLPSIMIIFSMIILSFLYVRRVPLISFAVLFYLINHSIESSFFSLEMVFEHRNYLPSFFLFLPVSAGLCHGLDFYRKKENSLFFGIIFLSGVILCFLFGTGTFVRNMAWTSTKNLWEDALEKAPEHSRPYHNLASAIQDEDPTYFEQLQIAGMYKRAARNNYSELISNINLSLLYLKKNELLRSKTHLKRVLELAPADVQHRKRYILLCLKTGDREEALAHADLIIKNKPDDKDILGLKGFVLLQMNAPQKALPVITKAYLDNLDDRRNLLNMGCALMMTGQYRKASTYLKKAKAAYPDSLEAHMLILQNALNSGDQTAYAGITKALFDNFSLKRINDRLSTQHPDKDWGWPLDIGLLKEDLKHYLVDHAFPDIK